MLLLGAQKDCWITLALESSLAGETFASSSIMACSPAEATRLADWSFANLIAKLSFWAKFLKKKLLMPNVDFRTSGCFFLRSFLRLPSLHHAVYSFWWSLFFKNNIHLYLIRSWAWLSLSLFLSSAVNCGKLEMCFQDFFVGLNSWSVLYFWFVTHDTEVRNFHLSWSCFCMP